MIVATFVAENARGYTTHTSRGATWLDVARDMFLHMSNAIEHAAVLDPQSGQVWREPRVWGDRDVRIDHTENIDAFDAKLARLKVMAAEGDKAARSELLSMELRWGQSEPIGWTVSLRTNAERIMRAVVRGGDKATAILTAMPHLMLQVANDAAQGTGIQRAITQHAAKCTAEPIYNPQKLICARCHHRDRQVMNVFCEPCDREVQVELDVELQAVFAG